MFFNKSYPRQFVILWLSARMLVTAHSLEVMRYWAPDLVWEEPWATLVRPAPLQPIETSSQIKINEGVFYLYPAYLDN